MPGSPVIEADITKVVVEWKSTWDLVLELSREPLEIDQICQLQKNVCLVERNNLLIECFTEGCLDLEL